MHQDSPSKKPTYVVKDRKAFLRLNASLYGFLCIDADIRFLRLHNYSVCFKNGCALAQLTLDIQSFLSFPNRRLSFHLSSKVDSPAPHSAPSSEKQLPTTYPKGGKTAFANDG